MKSHWGLVLPGQPMLVEKGGRQRGQSNSLTSEERGTEGFGLWFVGLCFFNLSFFFLKRKSPHPVSSFLWDLQFWQKSVFNLAVHIKILTV